MLSTVTRTVVIYITVIAALRLMGKRQLGELQPSELVTTLLVSDVASICIDEPDLPLLASLALILLLTVLEIFSSTLACLFPAYARLLFGKPVTVIRDGEILQPALRRLRITAGDLMEALRGKDIFSPAEVLWAVVEPNGHISTATKGQNTAPLLPVLVDDTLYRENLAALHLDEAWLDGVLQANGLARRQVLLLLYNGSELLLIPKRPPPRGGLERDRLEPELVRRGIIAGAGGGAVRRRPLCGNQHRAAAATAELCVYCRRDRALRRSAARLPHSRPNKRRQQ